MPLEVCKIGGAKRMKTKFKTALAILLVSSILCLSYAAIINTITINNTCNVVAIGIGVYADSACTIPLTDIAWGDVPRGGEKTFSFWIRSEAGNDGSIYVYWNTTVLPLGFTLSMVTDGSPWDPAPFYRTAGPMQVFPCTMTLSVANDAAVQAYNWYTHFSGSTTLP